MARTDTISRVTRTKQQAQQNYDRQSKFYDYIAGPSEKKFKDLGLRAFAAQPGETLLELGFGTGYCLKTLAGAVESSGRVYGIDLSSGMLAFAANRLQNAGRTQNVHLQLGDTAFLPFQEDAFDGIYTSFMLELIDTPEIPGVLTGCRRVLRKGGRLCVVALSKSTKPAVPEKLYEWAHRNFPVVFDCRPIFLKYLMQQAGFIITHHQVERMWGLPVEIVMGKNSP